MMKFRTMAATLALFAAPPALAQTAAPAPPAPVAMTAADPALWVVKDDDTTIYLFGTVHVLKPGLAWFDEGVKTAFDASSEVVLELVQPEPAAMQAMVVDKAIDRDGPPLSQKIPEAKRAAYLKALADFGVPQASFEPIEPWFAALTLSLLPLQKLGYDPNNGVEAALTAAAKAAGKPVTGIETAAGQFAILDGLSEATQIKWLTTTVDDLPEVGPQFDRLIASWTKGDPVALAEQMNESLDDSPELFEALLTRRNTSWAEWLDTRLDTPGTVFVAVGAGHLAGKGSVQDALAARKIAVTRVDY